MRGNMCVIKVENLKKSFGNHVVLDNVNIDIQKGDVVCVIGPSGGGKSTFLRCLNLLEMPTSGKIYFEGTDILDKKVNINEIRKKIGMVFQHFNLFPHLTILENMTLAPKQLTKKTESEIIEMAKKLLDRVGLADKIDAYPNKL